MAVRDLWFSRRTGLPIASAFRAGSGGKWYIKAPAAGPAPPR